MQADIYGKPVSKLGVGEATVLGAAILGGVGSGVFTSIEEGVDKMVSIEANTSPTRRTTLCITRSTIFTGTSIMQYLTLAFTNRLLHSSQSTVKFLISSVM